LDIIGMWVDEKNPIRRSRPIRSRRASSLAAQPARLVASLPGLWPPGPLHRSVAACSTTEGEPDAQPQTKANAVREDLEQLKERIPLLEYLRQRNWVGCRTGKREEFVGLCPLHPDTRPSFYVNAQKNLFYCHGCERGGDLIRFVELSERLSFRDSLARLEQQIAVTTEAELLHRVAAFYQVQLHRHSEAVVYLQHRGLHDPDLIDELGLGFAPDGNLRRHLA